MAFLHFNLVSPEKVLLDREVSQVVIPGLEGDIGVLPGHAPLLSLLRPGVISVYEDDQILVRMFISGGFSEIIPERCTALVTEATPIEALDKSALEIEIKNLLEDKSDSKTKEEEEEVAQSLDIARAKLMEILTNQKST